MRGITLHFDTQTTTLAHIWQNRVISLTRKTIFKVNSVCLILIQFWIKTLMMNIFIVVFIFCKSFLSKYSNSLQLTEKVEKILETNNSLFFLSKRFIYGRVLQRQDQQDQTSLEPCEVVSLQFLKAEKLQEMKMTPQEQKVQLAALQEFEQKQQRQRSKTRISVDRALSIQYLDMNRLSQKKNFKQGDQIVDKSNFRKFK